jgi:hypothetical protein
VGAAEAVRFHLLSPFTGSAPSLLDGVLFYHRVSCRTLSGRRPARRV